MIQRSAVLVVALGAVGGGPPLLAAQGALQWDVALSGVGMRVSSVSAPTSQHLSGAVFGLQGQITYLRRITLDLGYWQGQLDPSTGAVGTASRDMVEGYAMIGARPFGWLSLRAGPHAWTYISNAGTQRWFLWEGRVRAQSEVVAEVHSYIELWDVLSAKVNVPQGFQSGLGGEGGLILRLRDAPIIPEKFPARLRLSYGIERVRMGGGARTETMDRLSLSLGIEHR